MGLSATFQYIFNHPWSTVSLASWKKYPSTQQPEIVSIDLIDKHYDPDHGILRSKRVAVVYPQLPFWLQFYQHPIIFIEESIVDVPNQTMTLHNRNISLREYGTSDETCIYKAIDDETTELQQQIKIECTRSSLIERFIFNRYCNNIDRGPKILKDTIDNITSSI